MVISSIIGGLLPSIGSRGSITVTGDIALDSTYNGKTINWENINGGVISLNANNSLSVNGIIDLIVSGSGKIPRIQAAPTVTLNNVLGGFVVPKLDETVIIRKIATNEYVVTGVDSFRDRLIDLLLDNTTTYNNVAITALSSTANKFSFTSPATTKMYFDREGVLQNALLNIPRINWDGEDNSLAINRHFANLIVDGFDFTTASWTKLNSTCVIPTGGSAITYNGSTYPYHKLSCNATGGDVEHGMTQVIGAGNTNTDTRHCTQLIAAQGDYRYLECVMTMSGGVVRERTCVFDLQEGVINLNSTTSTVATIYEVPTNNSNNPKAWNCAISTFDMSSSGKTITINWRLHNGTSHLFTGVEGQGIPVLCAWGNSSPAPRVTPLPNNTTIASSDADRLSFTNLEEISKGAGTVYLEFKQSNAAITNDGVANIFSIHPSSDFANNRFDVVKSSLSSGVISVRMTVAGVTTTLMDDIQTLPRNTTTRIAVTFGRTAGSKYALAVNGILADDSSSALNLLTTFNRIVFGDYDSSVNGNTEMFVKEVLYLQNPRLNEEMVAMTNG